MLWYLANGVDNSPAVPESLDVSKSFGQQRTLPRDLRGFKQIKVIILKLSEMVARRVRQGDYVGRTVFLTLRDAELCFLSRSMSMPDIRICRMTCTLRHVGSCTCTGMRPGRSGWWASPSAI